MADVEEVEGEEGDKGEAGLEHGDGGGQSDVNNAIVLARCCIAAQSVAISTSAASTSA